MHADELDLASEMLNTEFLCGADRAQAVLAPPTLETLQFVVADHVRFLMENDFARLLACLYQIDVAEEMVLQAFQMESRKETAWQLAALILQRELTKAHSRRTRA
jgi:hypothetical protein